MTDNEIIKALSICYDYNSSDGCEKCPYYGKWLSCGELKAKDALDLINRQKAEIERLQNDYLSMQSTLAKMSTGVEQAKAEAIKEFAKRLHKGIDDFRDKREMVMLPYTEAALLCIEKKIDTIEKEMTEEHYETQ